MTGKKFSLKKFSIKEYLKNKRQVELDSEYKDGYDWAAGILLRAGGKFIEDIEEKCYNQHDAFDRGAREALSDYRVCSEVESNEVE